MDEHKDCYDLFGPSTLAFCVVVVGAYGACFYEVVLSCFIPSVTSWQPAGGGRPWRIKNKSWYLTIASTRNQVTVVLRHWYCLLVVCRQICFLATTRSHRTFSFFFKRSVFFLNATQSLVFQSSWLLLELIILLLEGAAVSSCHLVIRLSFQKKQHASPCRQHNLTPKNVSRSR